MNFIEEEIPSDNDPVNCLKSLKIKHSDKLLNDKGNVRLSDAERFKTYRANEHLQPLQNDPPYSDILSNYENLVLDYQSKISPFKRNPNENRASGLKNSHKKQKVMDSTDILANLWKAQENKDYIREENISENCSSVSD